VEIVINVCYIYLYLFRQITDRLVYFTANVAEDDLSFLHVRGVHWLILLDLKYNQKSVVGKCDEIISLL
jgi:hypothetical protein